MTPDSGLTSGAWRRADVRQLARRLRDRRFGRFAELVGLRDGEAILDVGAGSGAALERFTTTNPIIAVELAPNTSEWLHNANVVVRTGDGTRLPFADREFPVAFSDSVIEHVSPRLRLAFAAEIARVSERYYVQTPNRRLPLQARRGLSLLQDLARSLRRRPSDRLAAGAEPRREGAELLTARDLQQLFPDAEIHRHRVLGMTKRLMAVRGPAEVNS
jgi:hypothetical protein